MLSSLGWLIGAMFGLLGWLITHWPITLPLALGFVSIWRLLPRGRREPLELAYASGVGAVLLLVFLFRSSGSVVNDVLFYVFAAGAILAAGLMIVQRNPVHAALWFAVVILSTSGLFLLQSAPFLAAATVIVYAGAIIVTFLFVIMLAQQSGLAAYDQQAQEPLLATVVGFVLLGGLLAALDHAYVRPAVGAGESPAARSAAVERSPLSDFDTPPTPHVAGLGRSLFTDYLWAVELAGTLLLAATIGAIAISCGPDDRPRAGDATLTNDEAPNRAEAAS